MAITFRKYVDIVSGVGAGAVVRLRELILRIFTTNMLVPTGSLIEFESAQEVGDYFGESSVEYLRALFYFGWISKRITRARKLSFARWADAATAPQIFGVRSQQTLLNWTGISNGAFTMTIGPDTNTMSALDFTGAASLAAVATIIQTAIRTKTGPQWTAATVTYDAVRGSFNFTGGAVGAAAITTADPLTGSNLLIPSLLGWGVGSSAIFSDGSALETPAEAVTASTAATSNFGSFLFMNELSLNEVVEIANWNATENNMYMFLVALADSANAADYRAALKDLPGVGVTYAPLANEYPEMAPGMILAATDYSKVNATQNYMFQMFNLTPSVNTDTLSNSLDAQRINYYGATQTAGQIIEFYQRGLLQGLPVSPSDMNVYANEQWLKDFIGSQIMTALLALGRISANAEGRGIILTQVQLGVDAGLNNGTIIPDKVLTSVQKLYITDITDDFDAWRQVQSIGYWIDVEILPYVVDDRTEYKAVYQLIYSKDDAIRKVEGSHILI